MSEPMIISLQEVQFRQGTAHMAYTARACPRYLPLFLDDTSPDQIFLVHEQMDQYCRLHPTAPHMRLRYMSPFLGSRISWLLINMALSR